MYKTQKHKKSIAEYHITFRSEHRMKHLNCNLSVYIQKLHNTKIGTHVLKATKERLRSLVAIVVSYHNVSLRDYDLNWKNSFKKVVKRHFSKKNLGLDVNAWTTIVIMRQ